MELRGKRFVVIGGAGFIGSHTVDRLLREDVGEVVVYDNFVRGTRENLASALRDPRVRVYDVGGDILHEDILRSALKGADGVFHFAALWLLQCQEYPSAAFDVNVRGTFNVMSACAALGVQRLVFSSSASVYGDAVQQPMEESHPFNNQNFYGATKIAGEAMLRAFHHRYGLNYVGLRYMNVYGPRQDYRGAYIAVIMRMLNAIERNESPVIHGDGSESYDFVAVTDCAEANLLAMRASSTDEFYNVGTGVRTSLRELGELILRVTQSPLPLRFEARRQAGMVTDRVGSPKLARSALGFEAVVGLERGLRELVSWRASITRPDPEANGSVNPLLSTQ